MARERHPKALRIQIELEDNCGAVITRTTRVVPFEFKGLSPEQIEDKFQKFVEKKLPAE